MYLVMRPSDPTSDPDEFDTLSEALASLPGVAWRMSLIGYADQHLQGWNGNSVLINEQADYVIVEG